MDAIKGTIFSILTGMKQFVVPVYQRMYSWEQEQCTRLWNDIVAMQKSGKTGHFVGSIVNISEITMPTGVQKYLVIDGQQRMTTLMLMLVALRDFAVENKDKTTVNAEMIDNTLLKNAYETGDNRYRLLLTETDKDILISLIERKPLMENEKSRVYLNYLYFKKCIEKAEISPDLVYESLGKLQIVNITLDRASDDAQAIFESLNSTGKELSESDLIRNYILMGLDSETQTSIYERFWHPMEQLFEYEKNETVMDKFFRDYLTMKNAVIPNLNRIYDEFKDWNKEENFQSASELCENLYKYAKYYTDMYYKRSDNEKYKKLYTEISDLRMEVSYPFLLKVHNDFEEKIITEDEFIEIIEMCISYVLRRYICNLATNSLNKTFATLKNEVKIDDYLNSIKAFFVLRDDYKRFPNDEAFRNDFVMREIYELRNRNYIISQLENNDNKSPVNVENLTIEHIMPQNKNLNDDWKSMLGPNWKEIQKLYLHTIGNLTLTGYNSEMSDRSFIEKLTMTGGFKETAVRLNSYVVNQTEWTEEKIKERAQLLADKAISIWKYPSLTEKQLAPYKPEEKSDQRYSIDSYEVNLHTKSLFNNISKRIMNLSSEIKCEYKKKYVAFKIDTNFADIVFQQSRLRISLNMKYSDIVDEKGICKDITGLGRWGNGDVELFLEHTSDIDDVMEMIKQSYQYHAEEM